MRKTTTVFKTGNSLAVRLPKGFELPIGKVCVENQDGTIILFPTENSWPENFDQLFDSHGTSDWKIPARYQETRNTDW